MPLDYSEPEGKQIELRYRVFPAPSSEALTVVVVPGGPGSDIMRKAPTDAFALGAVPPAAFSIIYTDARGSGCNVYEELPNPAVAYTTEAVGRDLAKVVAEEELVDYLLYGASFGSAAATVATALAKEEGAEPPKTLVLEGAVGRAFSSFEDYFAAFEAEWERVLPSLDPAWRSAFETEPWPAELHWTRLQWGTFISAQLILGEIPRQGHLLNHWLSGLSQQDADAQTYVAGFMSAVTDRPPSQLFQSIACRELWGSWRGGREIREGKLRAIGSERCVDGSLKPYDSAEFELNVPIVYFHGPHDPTTTTTQAQYHGDAHPGSDRQFVTVPGASHAPLTLGLAGRGCAADVWFSIARATDLAAALATCTTEGEPPIEIERTHATNL